MVIRTPPAATAAAAARIGDFEGSIVSSTTFHVEYVEKLDEEESHGKRVTQKTTGNPQQTVDCRLDHRFCTVGKERKKSTMYEIEV